MRTQPHILEFFTHQAREQRLVTFQDVVRELGITEQPRVSTLASTVTAAELLRMTLRD